MTIVRYSLYLACWLGLLQLFIGSSNANEDHLNLRQRSTNDQNDNDTIETEQQNLEELQIELEIDGQRKLFPLLPGTKCPKGHVCHPRTVVQKHRSDSSNYNNNIHMGELIRDHSKTALAATFDWSEFDKSMDQVLQSDNFCSRRGALKRAAGLMAGLSVAAVSKPAYAAQIHEVLMGSEDNPEELVFEPDTIKICEGDSVRWMNNPGFTQHNVVFEPEDVPPGVDAAKLSMGHKERLKKDMFERKFTTKGEYKYGCTPHRLGGMIGHITVV